MEWDDRDSVLLRRRLEDVVLNLLVIESDTGRHFSIFGERSKSGPSGHTAAGMVQSCFSLTLLFCD